MWIYLWAGHYIIIFLCDHVFGCVTICLQCAVDNTWSGDHSGMSVSLDNKVAAATIGSAIDEFLQVQVLKSSAIWSFDGRNSEEGTNSNNINSNNNNSNNDNVNLFRILRQHFWFKKEEEEDETGAETMAPTTLAPSAPSVLRPPRYCLYWSLSWEKRCMRQCYGTSWQWLQCKSIVRVVMVAQW